MNNKGISTVIATVLIVLITVAAVTVLWVSISPLVDQNLAEGTSCFKVQNGLAIDSDKTYTCYDAGTGEIKFRLERSGASELLEGFEAIIDADGTTINSTQFNNLTSLPTNGAKVYSVTVTDDLSAVSQLTLSIAPRITIDGELASCEALKQVELETC